MTTKQKRQLRIDQYMSNKDADMQTYGELTIITYLSTKYKDRPVAVCFGSSKATKPYYHYAFLTLEDRDKFIREQVQAELNRQKRIAEEEKKWKLECDQIQPGTIMYSSWGYDQTNIDFYLVLSRSGMTVTIQEIGAIRVSDDYFDGFQDRGYCKPDPSNRIGDIMKKRVNKFGSIKFASYRIASRWTKEKVYWSSYA